MKALTSMLLAVLLTAPLAGCLVRTNHHHHGRGHAKARRNDCPPAYHWNGYKCVHNGRGKAKGHRK